MRKRRSVQNRGDALFRTGPVGGAAQPAPCERERSNKTGRGSFAAAGSVPFGAPFDLTLAAGATRAQGPRNRAPQASWHWKCTCEPTPPIRGFGPMGRDGGTQPMRPNLDGRRHPAAAAESSCPNTPAYTHAPYHTKNIYRQKTRIFTSKCPRVPRRGSRAKATTRPI